MDRQFADVVMSAEAIVALRQRPTRHAEPVGLEV
jgi:hypothetical protein